MRCSIASDTFSQGRIFSCQPLPPLVVSYNYNVDPKHHLCYFPEQLKLTEGVFSIVATNKPLVTIFSLLANSSEWKSSLTNSASWRMTILEEKKANWRLSHVFKCGRKRACTDVSCSLRQLVPSARRSEVPLQLSSVTIFNRIIDIR